MKAEDKKICGVSVKDILDHIITRFDRDDDMYQNFIDAEEIRKNSIENYKDSNQVALYRAFEHLLLVNAE